MPTRKPNRWFAYDYSTPGYYFVTICTKNHTYYFGDIIQGKMMPNENGKIAAKYWLEIPLHYQFVNVDPVYPIMPNHIHGIVVIDSPVGADTIRPREDKAVNNRPYTTPTLSNIINGYKKIVSKTIHFTIPEFEWQKSFYDHIIRKDESLSKIREYIKNNPKQWELDEYNPMKKRAASTPID